MAVNPRTGLPLVPTSSSTITTTGTRLSLTGNTTGVTSHSDSANATLYVLGDTALNGVCHANRLKSTLPAIFQSDERKKKNFCKVEHPFYALDRIQGYTFDYKEGNIASMGFKAQDIENIFPFLVDDTAGTKYVSYSPLIAVVWEATKELRDRQSDMCLRIQSLEEENTYLKTYIQRLPRLHTKVKNLEQHTRSLETHIEQKTSVQSTKPHGRDGQHDCTHIDQRPIRPIRPILNLDKVRGIIRHITAQRKGGKGAKGKKGGGVQPSRRVRSRKDR